MGLSYSTAEHCGVIPGGRLRSGRCWLSEMQPGVVPELPGGVYGPESAEDGLWENGPEVALFGGVAVQSSHPAEADVVAVLRDGVERVVQHSMGVELTWFTSAIRQDDDLESGKPGVTGRDGLDWDFVSSRRGDPGSIVVTACPTALLGYHWHPKHQVVAVHASFPTFAQWAGRDVGGLRVGVSMHRWAMYGGGQDLVRVTGPLSYWLLDAADALGADTGYITLDQVSAQNDQSPWERVTGFSPGARDVTSTLWGYGWGTLLPPVHLDRIGGLGGLRSLAMGEVRELPGGRVWFTLGADIATLDPSAVVALREVLRPALPVGSRTVEEYYAQPTNKWGPIIEQYVL